jgi:hypothetical protein
MREKKAENKSEIMEWSEFFDELILCMEIKIQLIFDFALMRCIELLMNLWHHYRIIVLIIIYCDTYIVSNNDKMPFMRTMYCNFLFARTLELFIYADASDLMKFLGQELLRKRKHTKKKDCYLCSVMHNDISSPSCTCSLMKWNSSSDYNHFWFVKSEGESCRIEIM